MTAGLMNGKRGLVMGVANDHSIAWGIARCLAAAGAELAFTYQPPSMDKRVKPLAASVGSDFVLPCDVGLEPDDADPGSVGSVFAAIEKRWGRLDFVVHAIAFSDKSFVGAMCLLDFCKAIRMKLSGESAAKTPSAPQAKT